MLHRQHNRISNTDIVLYKQKQDTAFEQDYACKRLIFFLVKKIIQYSWHTFSRLWSSSRAASGDAVTQYSKFCINNNNYNNRNNNDFPNYNIIYNNNNSTPASPTDYGATEHTDSCGRRLTARGNQKSVTSKGWAARRSTCVKCILFIIKVHFECLKIRGHNVLMFVFTG